MEREEWREERQSCLNGCTPRLGQQEVARREKGGNSRSLTATCHVNDVAGVHKKLVPYGSQPALY